MHPCAVSRCAVCNRYQRCEGAAHCGVVAAMPVAGSTGGMGGTLQRLPPEVLKPGKGVMLPSDGIIALLMCQLSLRKRKEAFKGFTYGERPIVVAVASPCRRWAKRLANTEAHRGCDAVRCTRGAPDSR